MNRYSDAAVAQELLHNDAPLQKRVRWFYRTQRKKVQKYVLQNGGQADEALLLMQDAMVALFHDLKKNSLPPVPLSRHFMHICKTIRANRDKPEAEREYFHPRLHEEKAMEKLFGRMDHGCEQILKAYYFEVKSPREISQQFGKPYEVITQEQKWPCLAKLKELLLRDEDLLRELKANLKGE